MKAKELILGCLFLYANFVNSETREYHIKKELISEYPKLIKYLSDNSPLIVNWITQARTEQSQEMNLLKNEGISIRTSIYAGPEDNMNNHVDVLMIDRNGDAQLDLIKYTPRGQSSHVFENPKDEASIFLWQSALIIAFRYSGCCKK